MIDTKSIAPCGLGLLAALLVACGTGCTSVLSSANLRDLVWAGDDHASEAAGTAADGASPGSAATPVAEPSPADAAADAERRQAAIEEAVARLSRLGRLDDAARATLIDTLDRTQQEDWPAVIDAFAESLAETSPPEVAGPPGAAPASDPPLDAGADAPPPAATPHVVAKADLDAAAPPAAPEPSLPPSPEPAAIPEPVASTVAAGTTPGAERMPAEQREPAADPSPPSAEPEPAAPGDAAASDGPLAIRNACFASRVQAWGVVDRFAADRFRAGQEVIVYFELDGLSAGRSPVGHTTCIDSTLRLVDATGRELHAWSFEPIAETCRARRHDYFARYVVRLPEAASAGECRLALEVTDTLSGQAAEATMPLEIISAADDDGG